VTAANSAIDSLPAAKPNALALSLFLAALPAFSALLFLVDYHRLLNLLGWSKSPGFILLLCQFTLAGFFTYRRVPPLQIVIATALLFVPVILSGNISPIHEIYRAISLPYKVWILADFLPLLLGATLVHRMRVSLAAKLAYLLTGAYIGSVYLYNAYYPAQHMNFFGGGWTA